MNDMPPPTDRLVALGPVKVWSMVVTILGDLLRRPDDRIEGPVLGGLVEAMGINNQALRTALHRLKRDGWIEARRDGRVSSYALTSEGRARTEAVRPTIYATDAPAPSPVFLILGDPAMSAGDFADAIPDDAVLTGARTALASVPDGPDGALVTELDGRGVPDWVIEAIAPADLRADFARLAEALETLGPLPDAPLAALTVRLAGFHHWRRLRLRHGPLPDLLLGDDWEGARARRAIAALRRAAPRPAPDDLGQLLDPVE